MKKVGPVTRLIGVFLLSWVVMSTMALAQQVNVVVPESVGMSSERLASIDKMAEKAVEEMYLKGVVVLVARHGKICYFKAFGEADEGKPMKTDSVFRLASMSKTPSAVALLQFWDQGRFQLRDPVSKYIPEFKDLQVVEMDENDEFKLVPAKRQITIHDLMSFTGGLSATYLAGLGPIHKYVADKYAEAGVQDLMNETYTKNLEQNVKAIAKCPLISQPGEAWCYNQTGLDMMAYLVEILSRKPFDQYLKEHIFDPLGAEEIWFYPPEEVFPRIPAV